MAKEGSLLDKELREKEEGELKEGRKEKKGARMSANELERGLRVLLREKEGVNVRGADGDDEAAADGEVEIESGEGEER
ncbi:hypothetical protein TWF730_001145 [Orbilia blumenaviensis]|uniref:Uncharacterized protein n=1 Tax=Orbilia blumenaviensis TaxID=1796055 RepID=A0AAV9VQL4_9PEZI